MKRSALLRTVLACGVLTCLGSVEHVATQEKGPAVKAIPLDTVYTSSNQPGFKMRIKGNKSDSVGKQFSLLCDTVRTAASNVFLVRGDTIGDALKTTYQVFNLNGSLDGPPSPVGVEPGPMGFPVHKEIWLVAYFGTGPSTPVAWVVDSVEHQGKTLRIRFHTPEIHQYTADVRWYFIWVPVTKLDPGDYTLELFATDRKKAVLTRVVTVSKSP